MCTVTVSPKFTWLEYASGQFHLHLIHGLALIGVVASKHSGQPAFQERVSATSSF